MATILPVRSPRTRGVTLLELILALSLSALLLMAMGMAINLYFKMLEVRRTNVEEMQIARAAFKHIADDLRTQVAPFKLDISGLEAVVANAAQASASSAAGGSGGMMIGGGGFGGGGGGFGGGGGGGNGGRGGGNDGGGRGGQSGDDGGGRGGPGGGNDGGGGPGNNNGPGGPGNDNGGQQDNRNNQGRPQNNQGGPSNQGGPGGGKGKTGGGGGGFAGGGGQGGGGQDGGRGGQQQGGRGGQGGNRGGGGMMGGGMVMPMAGGQQGQQAGATGTGADPNAAAAGTQTTEQSNVVNLYGTSTELRFDISRLPRVEHFEGVTQSDASGELVATDLPSDIKTVVYFLLSDESADAAAAELNVAGSIVPSTTGRGRGLMRTELDRAVTLYSESSGQLESLYEGGRLLAKEIVGLGFRYHDGSGWSLEWDSKTNGGLPRAIEITLTLQPTYAMSDSALATQMATTTADGTKSTLEQEFRLIVNLPSAPLIPETTSTTTDPNDPAAAAGGASGAASAAGGAATSGISAGALQ